MSRWSAYGRLDTQLLVDGDRRFTGLDMTRDRALLPPGVLALSQNKRLRNGSADQRLGNIQPEEFRVAFADVMIGSGVYSNPNAEEVILVATRGATYVWALQYGKDPVQVNLAAGQNLSDIAAVVFTQAFDKVLLHRNPPGAHPLLVWDGIAGHTFDVMTVPGAGSQVPHATHGEPFQNRVLYYYARWPAVPWRDQFVQSDVLEYNAFDNVLGVFRINAGESDWITRIWPYYRGSIIAFKRNTIHALSDFTNDPTLANQALLSKRMGLAATYAVVEDGNDLLFLSQPGGIYRLSEVIQEQIGAQPVPVSERIQAVIDQIDWVTAASMSGGARAETLGDYVLFALPIKVPGPRLSGNNAIAVMNTATKEWESVDSWLDSSFRIHALHVTQYAGNRALFGLDYTAKKIYVLYQQEAYDSINDDLFPIHDTIETRGYLCEGEAATSFKRYQRAPIVLRTSNPEVYVSAITDGVNEVKALRPSPLRKDPLKFYPHAHPDFNPATGDPLEARRRDYTETEISDFAGDDFENLPLGPIARIPPSTVVMGPHQEALERFPILVNARWCSLRIENRNGVCDVLSVGVEATPSTMETKTAA